ncbi:hypothetical protein K470DRAFT_161727 [Piedraia hortae CBS 480.64]|uniref:Uncharacterized protein n=1 Tax=Piedraia hortae CBS 480.64 TaxID=1314780 RepID=A0A6A7BR97_9PEZI|nr:hypothetical protein K470DRAFT_161727 [Piedraia hortae CBS 480.64]
MSVYPPRFSAVTRMPAKLTNQKVFPEAIIQLCCWHARRAIREPLSSANVTDLTAPSPQIHNKIETERWLAQAHCHVAQTASLTATVVRRRDRRRGKYVDLLREAPTFLLQTHHGLLRSNMSPYRKISNPK